MVRDSFRVALELVKKQPWLADQEEALNNLIFSECDSAEKQSLITSLLERFCHLSNNKFSEMIESLVDEIVADHRLDDNNVQIVAMAADSGADSSQWLLYEIKNRLERRGWRKHKLVNRFGDAYKTYKRSNAHRNIVLIDEFVGTGHTAISRTTEIKSVFLKADAEEPNIFVKAVVSTAFGLEAINDSGTEASAIQLLERGISDHYTEGDKAANISHMLELEGLLSVDYEGRALPSLGYGQCESLYARENGNTPNSVFPIFWWPFYRTGKDRNTVLYRAMGDA